MNIVEPLINVLLTLSVSVYTPGANHISGGDTTASGKRVNDLHAACGNRYPFGTVFEVTGPVAAELKAHGVSTRVVCEDRGSAVSNGHLDIALVTGNNDDRLKRAFGFGRRDALVHVVLPDPLTSQMCLALRVDHRDTKRVDLCQLRRAREAIASINGDGRR